MSVVISIIVSVLALLIAVGQWHLQRVHNEKSVKPYGQIDLWDRQNLLYVYIRNNGLGPLIIDHLTFIKADNVYFRIEQCLDLDPKSYMHVFVDDSVKRVVLPNAHFVVFEAQFEDDESETALDRVRDQLSSITLKVEFQDIYDNKMNIERKFQWFSRYADNL